MSDRKPCLKCGYIHDEGPCPIDHPDYDEAVGSYNKLLLATPYTPVTYGLMGINVLIFILMSVACMNVMMPPNTTLLQFGADLGPLTLNNQPWRLVTAMFVHIGIIHIAVNMWALYNVGPLAEKLLGNVGMLVVYFAAGIVGSVASLAMNPLVVSAGASGAIFGVFGAIGGVMLGGKKLLPQELTSKLLPQMGYLVVANLVLGFTIPGIDNSAHIGGLLTGFVAGLFAGLAIRRPKLHRLTIVSLVAFVALGASYGVFAWLQQHSIAVYLGQSTEVIDEFRHSATAYDNQELSQQQLAKQLEDKLLPQWKEIGESLDQYNLGAPADRMPLWRKSHDQREASWEALLDHLHSNNPASFERFVELRDEADKLFFEARDGEVEQP